MYILFYKDHPKSIMPYFITHNSGFYLLILNGILHFKNDIGGQILLLLLDYLKRLSKDYYREKNF